MATFEIPVTATCSACSADVPLPAQAPDDQLIACPGCGIEVGRFGAIRTSAVELVRKKAAEAARKAFKGIGKRR